MLRQGNIGRKMVVYSLKSKYESYVPKRGKVFQVESPVSCYRDLASFKAITGDFILIDNIKYKIKGIEMFMPGTPLSVGEDIGILVEEC